MSKLFKQLEKATQRLDKAIIKIFIFDFVICLLSYSFLYMLKENFSVELFQLLESILSLIVIIVFFGYTCCCYSKRNSFCKTWFS